MAFTRKFLSALGIEADKVDEIIAAHTEVTDALKEERDKYKADAEKLPDIEAERDQLKAQIEGEDPYKQKFEDLQEEFENYKTEIENEKISVNKEKALRAMLKEIGISEKRMDSVIKVTDINKIELDDEGKIKDGDSLKDNLKEEWSDFITKTKVEGAPSPNPPASNGKGTMTREEIRAISDPIARQKAMIDNPSLFGLPEE